MGMREAEELNNSWRHRDFILLDAIQGTFHEHTLMTLISLWPCSSKVYNWTRLGEEAARTICNRMSRALLGINLSAWLPRRLGKHSSVVELYM